MPLFITTALSKLTARLQASRLQTVANTATETSLLPGTISGSKTIPATFWSDGASIRVVLRGKVATRTLAPGTLTFRVKFGSTTLVSASSASLLGGGAGNFSIVLTAIYNGTDKVIRAAGKAEVPAGLVTSGRLDFLTPDTGIPWTTPVDSDVDVTAQWGSADAQNTISGVVCTVEQLSQ